MTDNSQSLTLESIGKLAGVSRSTVSRVLNDHPDVRPEVENPRRSGHREDGVSPESGRSCAGLQPDRPDRSRDADRGQRTVRRPLLLGSRPRDSRRAAPRHDSIFSIFPFYGRRGQASLLPTLMSQGFLDGVIATAGPLSDQLIATLRDRGRNVAVVGHPADSQGLRRVDVENRAGGTTATAHLCGLGRQRVGFVGPTSDYLYGVERLDGYRRGAHRRRSNVRRSPGQSRCSDYRWWLSSNPGDPARAARRPVRCHRPDGPGRAPGAARA